MKEQNTELSAIEQNAQSIILKLDCNGRVTFFNEFAEQFFGFTEDEILGHNAIGTIVPETKLIQKLNVGWEKKFQSTLAK